MINLQIIFVKATDMAIRDSGWLPVKSPHRLPPLTGKSRTASTGQWAAGLSMNGLIQILTIYMEYPF